MSVTVTKLDKDIIYQTINIGTNWIPKNEGCRLIHVPTRSVIDCVDHNKYHQNRSACAARLEQILKYPAPFEEEV